LPVASRNHPVAGDYSPVMANLVDAGRTLRPTRRAQGHQAS
jgi:hypothetical protein